ncbi:MAG TPA: hypothetical protein VFV42_07415 [Acidimicrobiales bacterium]|nr:hypothetical protein [Acidimicrobiales bacterium]
MGLLDRFKKAPGPDALTWEAVARARAVPGVSGAEAVDADTVEVAWASHPGTSTLSLAEIRDEWTKASGFARIELMDGVIAGLAPPTSGVATPEPPTAPAPAEPDATVPAAAPASPAAPDPTTAGDDPRGWAAVRDRLAIRVGPPGAGAVRWPVVSGLEATVVLDRIDGPAVTVDDLGAWRVDAGQVRAAAVDALSRVDPELDPIGPAQPAWVPTVPAPHPPVWLAAPARLLAAAGLTEAVALAPTPTELVVVDPSATELLSTVLAGTRTIVQEADDVLLAAPLLVRSDGVEEWRPPAEHPCAALAEELRST